MFTSVISKITIMKKLPALLLISFMSITLTHGQNLLVANNNPGAATGTNVFTGTNAIRDAFTFATAGDIIYVVPSPTSYGNLNITKSITIFGVGIRPSKDLGAKSLVGLINVDASDVRLSGLVSSNNEINLAWNVGTGNIDNIIIENCRTGRILMEGTPSGTVSDLLIRNNVITGNGSIATHILLNTTANAIITNNVMLAGGSVSQLMIKALNATFTYNLFSDNGNEGPFSPVINCTFDHNIFYGVEVDIGVLSTGNSWTYNLSFGNTTDADNVFDIINNGNTGTGNIESVAGSNDPLFVNFPLATAQTWNDSYDFSLQAGSPALNVNGEDIGPSGGATPFDFEGNLLPLIQSVTVPSVIPVGTDLPVTIKAKGN